MTVAQTLARSIRTIPDYPKPGILFRDINLRRTFIDQYFSRRICAAAF